VTWSIVRPQLAAIQGYPIQATAYDGRAMNKLIARVTEGLVVVLFLSFAAVWDVLISPRRNGVPVPILLITAILILVIFAPYRWEQDRPTDDQP